MKILNLRFKEVKNIKKEMTKGLNYLYSDDCNYSMCKDENTYYVVDNKAKTSHKYQSKTYSFDNLNDAVKKFKQLCRIK